MNSLMKFQADCGHWCEVHALEPTPSACPKCVEREREQAQRTLDNTRKLIGSVLRDIRAGRVEELPSADGDDSDEWMDEWSIHDDTIRNDIRQLVSRCDDVHLALDSAEGFAQQLLNRYKAAPQVSGKS